MLGRTDVIPGRRAEAVIEASYPKGRPFVVLLWL
jgi:hypothetical protein